MLKFTLKQSLSISQVGSAGVMLQEQEPELGKTSSAISSGLTQRMLLIILSNFSARMTTDDIGTI